MFQDDLVINVRDSNGNILANAYFEGRAFTVSALKKVEKMIAHSCKLDGLSESDQIVLSANMLEKADATFRYDTMEVAREIEELSSYKFSSNLFYDAYKNNGKIAIEEYDIADHISCSDAAIEFCPDREEFDISDLFWSFPIEDKEFADYRLSIISDVLNIPVNSLDDEEADRLLLPCLDKMPLLEFDPACAKFDEIGILMSKIGSGSCCYFVTTRRDKPTIYQTIE